MVATRCCAEWTFLKKIGLNCEIVVTRGVSRMLMMPKMLEQSLGFRMDGPSTLDLGLIAFWNPLRFPRVLRRRLRLRPRKASSDALLGDHIRRMILFAAC